MLTALAILVNGYHLGTGDSAVWIPAIKKVADPSLYPFNSEFFQAPAGFSLFPGVLGILARLAHAPVDWIAFLCYIGGVFLFLLAGWRLASACFENEYARWGGVALLGLLLALPVAGTGISVFDASVSARSWSSPFLLFAVTGFATNHYLRGAAWWLCALLVNLQMAVLGMFFLLCLVLVPRLWPAPRPVAIFRMPVLVLPFAWGLEPARGPAHDALMAQTSFFLNEWQWYQWMGLVAPLALLWCFALMPPKAGTPELRSLIRAMVPFGLLAVAAGLAVSFNVHLQSYARMQPMRAFHLIYILFVLLIGGLLGEFVMHRRRRRWLVLLVPAAAGIFLIQRTVYPASAHIELPRAPTGDRWVTAFLWIRDHTPKDAAFAVDPLYWRAPGEDRHGFRAIAERSVLVEPEVDGAVAGMFPQLAGKWFDAVADVSDWPNYELADFQKLAGQRPVTWIVDRLPAPAGMVCPYTNQEVAVCQIVPGNSKP